VIKKVASVRTHSFEAVSHSDDRPAILCIAGSDSSGMAGIQMDIRSGLAFSVHVATAITAVTAQNTEQFVAVNAVDCTVLAQQIDAALALSPQAIKIGLLANVQQVNLLVEKLANINVPIIYDPVIASSGGHLLLDADTIVAVIKYLLPLCTCITPNLPEADILTGVSVRTLAGRQQAAQRLLDLGASWVMLKGGHGGGDQMLDYCCGAGYLQSPGFWLEHDKIITLNSRGTGCALSSSLASALALGYDMRDALVLVKMAMQQGLTNAKRVNTRRGPIAIENFPCGNWPMLTDAVDHQSLLPQSAFPSCVGDGEPDTLGLYPVVDSAQWLQRLLPLGITTAQLRVKHLTGDALAREIELAIVIAKHYGCRLFINDYWQLAIAKGAYGVHLGQEDLLAADLPQIQQAGLRLGLSSHNHFEVARALAYKPSYLACGPVFATRSKQMPWIPHGIDGLNYWQQSIDYPLVAIGGINAVNIADVAATGVSGVAMISAITAAGNPELMAQQLMALIDQVKDESLQGDGANVG